MKTKALLGLVWMCSTGCVMAQDHAPTVELCRADSKVWDALLVADSHGQTGLIVRTVRQLFTGSREMKQCASVDSNNLNRYAEVVGVLNSAIGERANKFLLRHNLMDKFEEEDKNPANQ
jgi:hypothetical protein